MIGPHGVLEADDEFVAGADGFVEGVGEARGFLVDDRGAGPGDLAGVEVVGSGIAGGQAAFVQLRTLKSIGGHSLRAVQIIAPMEIAVDGAGGRFDSVVDALADIQICGREDAFAVDHVDREPLTDASEIGGTGELV